MIDIWSLYHFIFGIIYNLVLTGIGIFIMLITVCAWSFEPVNEPDSH